LPILRAKRCWTICRPRDATTSIN